MDSPIVAVNKIAVYLANTYFNQHIQYTEPQPPTWEIIIITVIAIVACGAICNYLTTR